MSSNTTAMVSRSPGRLGGEQLRQGRNRHRMRGVVPLAQDGVALRRGQNVQAPDRPVRCRKRRLEEDAPAAPAIASTLARSNRSVAYSGTPWIPIQGAVTAALLAKTDGEVELGGGGGDRLKRRW